MSPLPSPSKPKAIHFALRKALFCFNSSQNILKLLWFALTSFPSPPKPHCSHCPSLRVFPSCTFPPLTHRSGLKTAPLHTSLARSCLFHLLLLPSAGDCQREGWVPWALPSPLCLPLQFQGSRRAPHWGAGTPPSRDPPPHLAHPREAALAHGTAHPLMGTAKPARGQHEDICDSGQTAEGSPGHT